MNIEVHVAENEELKNWDASIEASPYGTIFHTLDWLRIVENHTNSKLFPLIGVKGEQVIGLFPIFYKKNKILKMLFSPPPKTAIPYTGPVLMGYENLKQAKKDSLVNEFYTQINNFINEMKPHYISLSFPPQLYDCRPFKWFGYQVEPEFNYILDISVGLSNLEPNFTYRARKRIEQAEKKGVKVELGSKKELLTLYDMLFNRYVDQGRSIPISKNYLLDIFNIFYPKNLKIFTLIHDGNIIGGVVKLCYKDKMLDWIGHPKTILGASDFLHRETMKWGFEKKYRYYEFIGANTPTISQFKSKFNPSLDVYYKLKKATVFGEFGEKTYSKYKNYLNL